MEICYEHVGLIAWWYDLGAQAQVACMAAAVALLIYALNRWHARSDLLARRKALHAIARGYVEGTLHTAKVIEITAFDNMYDTEGAASLLAIFRIEMTERLVELQLQLVSVARHGDEAITEFIEACRNYDKAVMSLRSDIETMTAKVRESAVEDARRKLLKLLALRPKVKAALAR